VDEADFESRLQHKLDDHALSVEAAEQLRSFQEQGYLVLPGAIEPELIDRYLADLDRCKAQTPSPLKVTSPTFRGGRPYEPGIAEDHRSTRIVDSHYVLESARALLLHPVLKRFLHSLFERVPVLTQSLYFEYGSEQPVHQDTAYVIMNSPLRLAASWIALEDIAEGSGELCYYPGSHRFPDFRFSERFKHFDMARDGADAQARWLDWLHEEATRRGIELEVFRPKKGDVLIWHADLAHGGSPIRNPGATRRSLVGHYCPRGVLPLYAYYMPDKRRRYRHDAESAYMASFYP